MTGRTAAPALAAALGLKALSLRCSPLFRTLGAHPGGIPERLSQPAALRAARAAYEGVPAYRDFVHGYGGASSRRLTDLPVMDKASYIDAYPLGARCVGG